MEKEMDSTAFNGIYADIAEHFGNEMVIKIYEHFRGMQVTFPVKLYSMNYIIEQVTRNTEGESIKEIARKYHYSEQWLRRIKKKKQEELNGNQ